MVPKRIVFGAKIRLSKSGLLTKKRRPRPSNGHRTHRRWSCETIAADVVEILCCVVFVGLVIGCLAVAVTNNSLKTETGLTEGRWKTGTRAWWSYLCLVGRFAVPISIHGHPQPSSEPLFLNFITWCRYSVNVDGRNIFICVYPPFIDASLVYRLCLILLDGLKNLKIYSLFLFRRHTVKVNKSPTRLAHVIIREWRKICFS